ncbi:MAG TPA: DUF58 domain-containing protein [Rhodanobacteraceae bacterium]|jgi:uncharacterized protein (DUF58 family)|nr:DUF58 domain-containing protein [Rhodanobacteraceae bacterium]
MTATLAAIRTRALALAERRLPALTRLRQAERLPIRLDRRRIYVLPTGFGLMFALLMFVMLLGALNYANNPALLLTCMLAAACGASLFVGFRAMNGLALTRVEAGECHAGESLPLRLRFAESPRMRAGLRLRLGDSEAAFALAAGGDYPIDVPLATTRRGRLDVGRLRLSTEFPLGLFHIWSWLHPDASFVVYPEIETPAPPLPDASLSDEALARSGAVEESGGLRDYRVTDPPRQIAWKPSARHDTLLVRDVERAGSDALVLDYYALAGLDRETRIRRLAAWVVAADAAQREYTLRLPDETIGPGAGITQRRASLRALALLPFTHA